jgi:hypothetical protein
MATGGPDRPDGPLGGMFLRPSPPTLWRGLLLRDDSLLATPKSQQALEVRDAKRTVLELQEESLVDEIAQGLLVPV